MRILLAVPRRDENLPRKLKVDFREKYDVKTVRDMGWLGKKNGELLKLIDEHEFDFFVTVDKNLRVQQNLAKYNIKIFLLIAVTNRRESLQGLIEKVKQRIATNEYAKVTLIS